MADVCEQALERPSLKCLRCLEMDSDISRTHRPRSERAISDYV